MKGPESSAAEQREEILLTLNRLLALTENLPPNSLSALKNVLEASLLAISKNLAAATEQDADHTDGTASRAPLQRSEWVSDSIENARRIREQIIVLIGTRGIASISEILKHLNINGARVDRSYVTVMLSRLKNSSKAGRKPLLRSIADQRGFFALTDDGFDEYKRLSAVT